MNCPITTKLLLTVVASCLILHSITGQSGNVVVDDQGVLRWTQNKGEIQGFGANYTTPFAHAYRSAVKLGIDPLKAIDEDVYHFARLGFDLYRVHVWDTEISDTLGNLLFNEHLNAFDYLLKKLSERNINYILTPIAFWGNGWPEPDESTPGFSAKYGKDNCLTNPGAIKAQQNYLYQFMNHVNPYTGLAYKDDPRLIAIEISNEPHHREDAAKVTTFIKGMVAAVRKTGYKKPVFYNVSHSVHLAEAYFKSDIQGGTFQWYPTGLGYQQELPGNFLPNVDDYNIPFDDVIKKAKGAKIVYEFDAADVGRTYMYPAMARSFREAGIQLATHFAYDPMFLAFANTEYNTHYMNLAYTPGKALALKICSEIFHRVPMYKNYGAYPKNTAFEDFSISYEQDLALLNTEEKYFHTNATSTPPKNAAKLAHIAGCGHSPIVSYTGTGAYFLDKLENGVWRLEVMPDPLIVSNPYGRNSLDKRVAVIQHQGNHMVIRLEDLGSDFQVVPLNDGNKYQAKGANGKFVIVPGAYLLTKTGIKTAWDANDRWQNIRLGEFHAPVNSVDHTFLIHKSPEVAVAGVPLHIEVQAISPDTALSVAIQITQGNWTKIDLKRQPGFTYAAEIPADQLKPGFLTYYLFTQHNNATETWPAGKPGLPWFWDFYDREPYRVRVVAKEQPLYLFQAEDDAAGLSVTRWSRHSELVPTDQSGESEYQVKIDQFLQKDNENQGAAAVPDYSLRYYFNPKISAVRAQLSGKKTLVVKARCLDNQPKPVQVALTTKDGTAYGKIIELGAEMKTFEIPLSELKKVNTVTMPRPYPTFLPYYFNNEQGNPLRAEDLEGLQISIGPGLPESRWKDAWQQIGVVSVGLR